MKLPRDITPGQAARRALLADMAIAVALALVAIAVAAGIGVVGFFALVTLLVIVAWIAAEATVKALLRRRIKQRRSDINARSETPPPPSRPDSDEEARGADHPRFGKTEIK